MDFIDLRMEQDKDGYFDLVFTDGGLALDYTLETSIAATLFTDSYYADMNIGKKRGGFGLYFGNRAWTQLEHSRDNDESVISYINSEYNRVIKQDFVENNVWEFTNIEVQYILGSLYINLTGNNSSLNNGKFDYNYKISGVK